MTVVMGEGFAALGAIARALKNINGEVHWVAGSGGRVIPAFASIESAPAASVLEELCQDLQVEIGPRLGGSSFVREFRNRSFREPAWQKGAELSEKREIRAAELWAAENSLVPVEEVRWELSLVEIEEQIRAKLLGHPRVRRVAGVPIDGFRVESGVLKAVNFGSGEELVTSRVVYADRWSQLGRLSGLPKPLSFLRGRDSMGVLQVVFGHTKEMCPEVTEGFFATLTRDSGDTQDRQVFGHFYRGGSESVWTSVVSFEEGEDNHWVAKRLRKMKQTLEKMFSESEWAPGSFAETIKNEQVRYEEGLLICGGDLLLAPVLLEKGAQAVSGVEFLTDGYGVGPALLQSYGA